MTRSTYSAFGKVAARSCCFSRRISNRYKSLSASRTSPGGVSGVGHKPCPASTSNASGAYSYCTPSRYPIPRFPDSRFPDSSISRFPDSPITRFPDFPLSSANSTGGLMSDERERQNDDMLTRSAALVGNALGAAVNTASQVAGAAASTGSTVAQVAGGAAERVMPEPARRAVKRTARRVVKQARRTVKVVARRATKTSARKKPTVTARKAAAVRGKKKGAAKKGGARKKR